jgi:anti-sigma regulatory factor (Ser/Thr protein kinase)
VTADLETGARDALVLAIHEAVANGVEHASGSPVRVEGRVENGALLFEIKTKGSWQLSQGAADQVLAERGRGLTLMRGLTEQLEVLVDDESVTIRLRPSQA